MNNITKGLAEAQERHAMLEHCVYEVCGCSDMADAHCMTCLMPITAHRRIPKGELEEIQRLFASYQDEIKRLEEIVISRGKEIEALTR